MDSEDLCNSKYNCFKMIVIWTILYTMTMKQKYPYKVICFYTLPVKVVVLTKGSFKLNLGR